MKDALAHFAEKLSLLQEEVFLLQVGAMDGESFDPMRDFVEQYGWRGILIEPLPWHFNALRSLYGETSSVQLENIAISDRSGMADFYYIDPVEATENGLPKWVHGISSLDRGHLEKHKTFLPEIEQYIKKTTVQCDTLDSVIEKYAIARIDVFQIDAEGHDYRIFKQLDLQRFRPKIISLEVARLSQADRFVLMTELLEEGYILARKHLDLVATDQQLVAF